MPGTVKVVMAEGLKLIVDSDGIATVHMVNGENRFRLSFMQAWMKILDEIERNDAIKGLIITGTDKYFSLGLDLDYFATQQADYIDRVRESTAPFYRRLKILPIPTVAAINGHAYGAGAFIAISCDYCVMREDRGWLCFPETALGMRMGDVSFQLIRLKIGTGKSQRDAVIFSKRMSALEAHELHIVDVVASADNLLQASADLIKECLGKHGIDRKSLGQMKKDVYGIASWKQDNAAKL